MDTDQIAAIDAVAATGGSISIIDIQSKEFNPYSIIDLENDDLPSQRGITQDDKIIHIVDAIVAGRYGSGGSCAWAFKVLSTKKGVFEFTIKINGAIEKELNRRVNAKMPYKQWKKEMSFLITQLFIWDFDLLNEALKNTDVFINEYVLD